MTEALKKTLLDFSNDKEPFLTHNHMYTADLSDGCATVVLPMCEDSLNRWGGAHGGILFSLCDVAAGMAISNTNTFSSSSLLTTRFSASPSRIGTSR